ncbi:MAG: ribosome silencing factor [Pirellulales bacterium]|nr:ribosome silencing factor [Pirellulales bacterium]MCH2611513.1 ribosome silencing factor [Pirellulales bacterium]HCP84260.1 ribosome silencing factor [Planctomycetaceae bacterium]
MTDDSQNQEELEGSIPSSDRLRRADGPDAEQRYARSLELARAGVVVAYENGGRDIKLLDMRQQSSMFDYFVVATGSSRRQLHAISEDIDHKLEDDLQDKRMGLEGYDNSRWILLDYGSVVFHLFDDEAREYYSLESLWAGAEEIDISDLLQDT